MRAALFTFVYYLLSVFYVLASVPFLILPGHTPGAHGGLLLSWSIRAFSRL